MGLVTLAAGKRCGGVMLAAPAVLPAAPAAPTRLGEVPWLQPFPDAFPSGLADAAPGPEARYESREAISLAFVTAVQLLPPSQRAVLLLRDVLGYRASETAELLGLTQDAVTGALKRARATLAASRASGAPAAPPPGGPRERALLETFVTAFTALDVSALIALLTDHAWVRMPPLPFEYQGPQAARRFFTATGAHRRRIVRLVPARANGQPAWGEYTRAQAAGPLRYAGLLVVALAGRGIREITHFETAPPGPFGLAETLAAGDGPP